MWPDKNPRTVFLHVILSSSTTIKTYPAYGRTRIQGLSSSMLSPVCGRVIDIISSTSTSFMTYPACGRTRILGLSPSRTSPRMWQRTGVRSWFQKMSAARRTPTRGSRSSSCPPPTASSFSSSRTSCRPPSALTCLKKVHFLSSF
jgi:hypothetical protein